MNKTLLDEIEALKAREASHKDEVQRAMAATEVVREELRVVLECRSEREVELARARHGYETDEILVVGLKG